jgi:diguanylate cyclase (GGDEF)-like protein
MRLRISATEPGLKKPLDSLIRYMTGLSRRQAVEAVWGVTVLLAACAFLLGPTYSFAAPFLLPISFAAWTLGFWHGVAVGAATAAFQVWLSGWGAPFAPHLGASLTASIWNASSRFMAILLVTGLVSGFRRSFDEQRRRARIDQLTGALNKAAFEDRVETTLAIARRHGLCVVLAYADLDGFKGVNDTHGHATGDKVLKTFAEAACRQLRPTDSFARAGGDEFMALMPVATVADGYAGVTRLHAVLRDTLDGMGLGVGCSMGAVVMENGGSDEAGLVQIADALMYEVKRSGKAALRIATVSGDAPERRRTLATRPKLGLVR